MQGKLCYSTYQILSGLKSAVWGVVLQESRSAPIRLKGTHAPARFQELLAERGINVDHSTIWRWVQRYAPKLNDRQRQHLKPVNRFWRVDETYIRVKGEWCYLYRSVDSQGATIDYLLLRQLCGRRR